MYFVLVHVLQYFIHFILKYIFLNCFLFTDSRFAVLYWNVMIFDVD